MGQVFSPELVKGVVFQDYGDHAKDQDYGDHAKDSVFRFSRSEIANTLETAHGVESYEGFLDDIDSALFQLYGHGIEPCLGAGRVGAQWKFGPASHHVRSKSRLRVRLSECEPQSICCVGFAP
jgi:hypothetical protein